eukprot:518332-Alexandrium_andersonii.AAC.1
MVHLRRLRGGVGSPAASGRTVPLCRPPDATGPRAWARWCLHRSSGADAARSSRGAGSRSRTGVV